MAEGAPQPATMEDNLDTDVLSDKAEEGSLRGSQVGSQVGSMVGSQVGSMVSSKIPETLLSAKTAGQFSAFTAPPRYRNSGAFVHGTKFKNFRSIMEQGLRAAQSDIFMIDEVRIDGRVPGLREPPEMLIFIDETKARTHNMDFDYDSTQGTWKTKGINGVIRPWFFQKVVDQRPHCRGNVLFQSREDPMLQANVLRGALRPPKVLHATYWENLRGIMQEGLRPCANPKSSLRAPFKGLLQGAENVVYTVNPQRRNASGLLFQAASLARQMEPEVVPEDEEPEPELHYKVDKGFLGMERQPDCFLVIDSGKAEELGLTFVQSADREETVFIQGTVPPEVISSIEVNEPVYLPECLKAKIVDPRSFEDIPIIDLAADEATVVEQLRYACEVVGFLQVIGHGVSDNLISRHMELQRQFFQLPAEAKARFACNAESPVRGYFGRGYEDLDQVVAEKVDAAGGKRLEQQTRKDNKEALDCNGVPWSKPVGGNVARCFAKQARLPDDEEILGFRESQEEYSRAMFDLARRLLSLMALALGHDKDFFQKHLTNPVCTHRLLHYWPLKDLKKEIGVGEHTDYGLLTILMQDVVGGLQVLNAKDLRWVHCCPIEGAFVVNIGDMMARWTGNRFKSTVHRVVNISQQERYSVPFFVEPNMDTLIVPGALCPLPPSVAAQADQHRRRCAMRKWWQQVRNCGPPATAEEILGRFYQAATGTLLEESHES